MSQARVTVVVATYQRPDILPVVLRSALAQGKEVARVLVIGDCCDDRTAAACASLHDSRIRYINLPSRFGEQSGPNSVGMILAETELVAFLNHDDIMLPGHIDMALDALDRTKADLFVGRAALAHTVQTDGTGRALPRFGSLSPEIRKLPGALASDMEPASAWVFRRSLANRVGTWRPAATLYRNPMEDWLLRAWRSKIRVVFGDDLSVLYIGTQYNGDPTVPAYEAVAPEYLAIESWIDEVDIKSVRRSIVEEVSDAGISPKAPPTPMASRIQAGIRGKSKPDAARWLLQQIASRFAPFSRHSWLTTRLFRLTGVDLYSARMRMLGRSPGAKRNAAAVRRTGSPLPEPPHLDEILRHIASPPTDSPRAERT